jgi:transcriptional regulator with XRE-family HTH domain
MAKETIGQRLRRLRLERGLSQRDVASPGVTNAHVSRIEQGTRTPSVSAIRAIAEKLGVSPEYLETGSNISPSERRRLEVDTLELELRLGRNLDEVRRRLNRLHREAKAASDAEAELGALRVRGLLSAHEGQHESAITDLATVVGNTFVTPALYPDVFATLARSLAVTDGNQKAVDLLRETLRWLDANKPEDAVTHVRFATYLGYALTDLGSLDEARDTIEAAIERAREVDDPYTRVRLYWSEARLAAVEDDPVHAQAALRRATGLLESLDDSAHLGRAHRMWAEILLDEQEPERAREHLVETERLLGVAPDAKDEAPFLIERARLAIADGQNEKALADLARVGPLVRDDVELRGRAEWVAAELHREQGQTAEAVAAFERAGSFFGPRSRYRPRMLREWASMLEAAGSIDDAFAVLRGLVFDNHE